MISKVRSSIVRPAVLLVILAMIFVVLTAGFTCGVPDSGQPAPGQPAAESQIRYTIFAGTTEGIYTSTDGGVNWNSVSNGLPGNKAIPEMELARGLTVYAGVSGGGVYKTTDAGLKWSDSSSGIPADTSVYSLAMSPDFDEDGTVYAGASRGGIFKTTDEGGTWSMLSNGIPNFAGTENKIEITALAISPNFKSDKILFAGSNGEGIFKSEDGGGSWRFVDAGVPTYSNNLGVPTGINSLSISPNFGIDQTVFAGTTEGGVYKSNNGGASWIHENPGGPPNASRVSLVFDPTGEGKYILYASYGAYVWKFIDGAAAWTPANTGIPADATINQLAIAPGPEGEKTIYAAARGGIFKSTDDGTSWSAASAGIPPDLNVLSLAFTF